MSINSRNTVTFGGLAPLMEACEEHRRQHELGQAGGEGVKAKATCIAILQKLKSILPKLLKLYLNPRTANVADTQGICHLLSMILSKSMCEHGDEVFEHGQLTLVAPRVIATFRLLTFSHLAPAHPSLRSVTAQLLNLVEMSDLAAYDRLFADLGLMLEDGQALLRLLLRRDVEAALLFTPESKLAIFQETLRMANDAAVAEGTREREDEEQRLLPNDASTVGPTSSAASAHSRKPALDAEAAFVPLPTFEALFLLLSSATSAVTSMLRSSAGLASSPAAWSLFRSLGTQLRLTVHPCIQTLSLCGPKGADEKPGVGKARREGRQEEGAPALGSVSAHITSLQTATVTALDVLLATAGNALPLTVQVPLVASMFVFLQGELAWAQGMGKGGASGETRQGAPCETPALVQLLRCLLAFFHPSASSTGLATLLPTTLPGLGASLDLCLSCPPSPPPSFPPSSFPSLHVPLIRRALLCLVRRVLSHSVGAQQAFALRRLPWVAVSRGGSASGDDGAREGRGKGGEEGAWEDRWYLMDCFLCLTTAVTRHPKVAVEALYAWREREQGRREVRERGRMSAQAGEKGGVKRPRRGNRMGGGEEVEEKDDTTEEGVEKRGRSPAYGAGKRRRRSNSGEGVQQQGLDEEGKAKGGGGREEGMEGEENVATTGQEKEEERSEAGPAVASRWARGRGDLARDGEHGGNEASPAYVMKRLLSHLLDETSSSIASLKLGVGEPPHACLSAPSSLPPPSDQSSSKSLVVQGGNRVLKTGATAALGMQVALYAISAVRGEGGSVTRVERGREEEEGVEVPAAGETASGGRTERSRSCCGKGGGEEEEEETEWRKEWGKEAEEKPQWRELVRHVTATAAELLSLLPFGEKEAALSFVLLHAGLNLALTCVDAIPQGCRGCDWGDHGVEGRERSWEGTWMGQRREKDGGECAETCSDWTPMLAALLCSVHKVLECLRRPGYVKAMLQERVEGGAKGGGQVLTGDEGGHQTGGDLLQDGLMGANVPCLAQAQRLGCLDKMILLVCTAGPLFAGPSSAVAATLPPSGRSQGGGRGLGAEGSSQEEKALGEWVGFAVKERQSLEAVMEVLRGQWAVNRLLQLMVAAKEKAERPVRVAILRFLPLCLEGVVADLWVNATREDGAEPGGVGTVGKEESEGGTQESVISPAARCSLLVAGCLAVGLRLLHLWRRPQDLSGTDPSDPALPALARFLHQVLLLLDVQNPTGGEEQKAEGGRLVAVRSRKCLHAPTHPRVRLIPSSLESYLSDSEDLSILPVCLTPHFDLIVTLALPFSSLLDGSLPASVRLPTVRSLFHLLVMTPAHVLYTPPLRVSAQALCHTLWDLLGDGEGVVREAVAERSIGFLVQQGKLARLMMKEDLKRGAGRGRESNGTGGSSALASKPTRTTRSKGEVGGVHVEGGDEDEPREDLADMPCEWAIRGLVNRFKSALRSRQKTLEGDSREAPIVFGTLLQAMGALAVRAPVEKGFESVYLWVVLRLVEVWTCPGMICNSFAYEQLVRVARQGKYVMEEAMARDADEVLPLLLRTLVRRGMVEAFVREVLTDEGSPKVFLELSLKYAIAAVVQDENQEDMVRLAKAWERYVEPTLACNGGGRKPGREERTAVERMLTKLAPMVVPRLLVEDASKLPFLMERMPEGYGGMGELMGLHDQSIFCELIWEWGEAEERGETERAARAHRALDILMCTKRQGMLLVDGGEEKGEEAAGKQRSAQTNGQQGREAGRGTPEDLSDFVASYFLFALSTSILPADWEQRTPRKNAIAMRCLRLLLELMGPVRVPVFFPKILSIMKVMLWEGSQRGHRVERDRDRYCQVYGDTRAQDEVKEMACHVMSTFVRSLPDADLKANMAVLVMNLLPSILPVSEWAGDTAWYCGDRDRAQVRGVDPHCQWEQGRSFPFLQAPLSPNSHGRTALIQLLNWLIVDRQASLRVAFPSIPFLPHQLPELAEARQVFLDALPPPSQTTALLRRLVVLLNHHSWEVRYATLRQLRAMLRESRQQVCDLILGANDTAAEDVVSELLTVLLRLSAEESIEDVSQIVCACLGELGAIDPARVSISLFDDRAARSAALTSSSYSASVSTSSTPSSAPLLAPWHTNDSKMALELLEHMLVPKLRAATADKDRFPYAVQELLHLLYSRGMERLKTTGAEKEAAHERGVDLEENGQRKTGASSGREGNKELALQPRQSDSRKGRREEGQGEDLEERGGSTYDAKERDRMPEWLQDALTARGMLDIVLPYWSTNYVVSRSIQPKGPPFLNAGGGNFEKCVSQMVRYLLERAVGPFADVMYKVRGLVRLNHALPHFLLPYLVAETWCYGDKEEKELVVREILSVLSRSMRGEDNEKSEETYGEAGLRRRADSDDHVATQAILSLLDTVTEWCNQPVDPSLLPSGAGADNIPSTCSSMDDEGDTASRGKMGIWEAHLQQKLQELLRAIPEMVLVKASMRIGAHSRALKHLESHVRKGPRADGGRESGLEGGPPEAFSIESSMGGGGVEMDGAMLCASPTATDGANNTLPVLNSEEIDLFQKILACLDEPDSLTGLAAARRKARRPTTTTVRQRIREYEHAEEWSNALQGYEQALQELEQGGGRDMEEGEGGHGGGEEVELSRGVLQSLLEMEHNESAMNQFLGMIARKPSLQADLLPLGAEACWRLQKWPALREILRTAGSSSTSPSIEAVSPSLQSVDGRFQLSLGRVLQAMESRRVHVFEHALREARAEARTALSAAAVESYPRAYPSLVRLHVLHELEQGFELLTKTASPKLGPGMNRGKSRLRDHGVGSPASIFSAGSETCQERTEDGPCDERAARKLLEDWQWAGRLSAMMPSVRQCAPVMAARRTLFQMARFQGLMVENWVATAEQAQDAGRFRLAESALRHAACWGLGGETLLVEEAKLLHAQGKVHEALLLLEPVDVDLPTLRRRVTDAVRHGTHLQGEDVKRQAATRLLLATDWMVQAGVKHGQQVLDRYKLALELRPKSEAAFFAMAKYTDFLLEARKKELEAGSREGAGGEEGRESGESGAGRGREREEKLLLGTEDELLHSYYRQALENYAVSLQHGLDNIFQSLPRFLTLAFEVGDMADLAAPRAGGAGTSGTSTRNRSTAPSHARVTAMDKLLQHCSLVFRRATQHVVSCAWYTALPQLLSQVGSHGAAVGAGGAVGSEVQGLILEAIVKVLEMHPEQAMWSTTGLIFSRDSFRRRAGERILRSAHTRILDAGAEEAARMLLDGKKLFTELLALANDNSEPPPDKRLKIHIGKRLHLLSFLVPVQAALTVSLPRPSRSRRGSSMGGAFGSLWASGKRHAERDRPGGGGGGGGGGGAFAASQRTYLMPDAYHDAFPNAQMQIRMFGDTAYVLHSKAKPKKITVYTTCEKQLTFLCKQERSGDLRKDARMMEFNGIVNRLLQRDAEGRRRKLRLRTYAVVCLNEECGLMEWVTDTACLRGCIVESARGVERQSKYLRFSDLRRIVEGMQASHKDDPTAMAREFRSQVLPFFPPTLHRWFFKRFAEPTAWLEARTIFTRSAAVWSAIGHVVGLGDRHGENILIDTARGECVHVDFDCLFDKGLTLARPELVPFRLTPNMVDAMGVVGYEGPFRRVMEVTLTVLREHRLTLLSVLEPFLADPTVGWDHMRSGPHLSVIDERLRGIYNLRVPARRSSSSATARSKSKQQQQQQQQHRQQSDVALPLSIPGQVQKLIQEATALENLARMYIGWQSWM